MVKIFKYILISLLLSYSSVVSSSNILSSAVILDAQNGQILYHKNANAITYPASLTKMMTLYILFEKLNSKLIALNSVCLVSDHAASQPSSHLKLEKGEYITIKQAILALIVKSANDVAVAVAEKIAGDETTFAKLMTQKAYELGMYNTVFKNASGLPNKYQVTTAQDMAILGLKLCKNFPQYYKYFKIGEFWFKGRQIKSHNRLLKKVLGYDGIKTGFINASGYNLVSSVKRNGKRYIVVVLGGKSRIERDKHSSQLIELAFRNQGKPFNLRSSVNWPHKQSLEAAPQLVNISLNKLVAKAYQSDLANNKTSLTTARARSHAYSGYTLAVNKKLKRARLSKNLARRRTNSYANQSRAFVNRKTAKKLVQVR